MNLYEDPDQLSCDGCYEDCETSINCPFADPRTPDEIAIEELAQDAIREKGVKKL